MPPSLFERTAWFHAAPLASSSSFHPESVLAGISGLSGSERAALSGENDPTLFFEDLLAAGRAAELRDEALASRIYQAVAAAEAAPHALAERATARLATLGGTGASAPRAEHLLRRLARDAMEPGALVGMAAAGAAFRLTRLALLSRIATTPSLRWLATRGLAGGVAGLGGFAVEATVFPMATRATGVLLGREQDWSLGALGHELAGSFLVLGGMKLAGAAGTSLFNRGFAVDRLTGEATRFAAFSGLARPLVNQGSQLGGILFGHALEEAVGLRPHQDGATTLTDSLTMLLQFHVAGRLSHGAFGEHGVGGEAELDRYIDTLETPPPSRGLAGLPHFSPLPAGAAAGVPDLGAAHIAMMTAGDGAGFGKSGIRGEAEIQDVRPEGSDAPRDSESEFEPGSSALIEAARRGKAGLFAQFGGQANRYFGELRNLHRASPELREFIEGIAAVLERDAASPEAVASGHLPHGLNLREWLHGDEPAGEYLSSAAVSQPLIALTQLGHYYRALSEFGLEPGEMRDLWRGTTGHSQGVMASVVVASSSTRAEFFENSARAVRYLLWQGIRMTDAAPATTLHPATLAASAAAGEPRPTPMLGILKLSPETVARYVAEANQELGDRPVEISLVNGPRAVVVSGHPESLVRFRERLARDAATEEQGRVPFSERKLEFVSNYFEVYGPYHTRHYMAPVPEALARDLTRLGIHFDASQLAIPVYSTETGENLQGHPELTTELIRLQSLAPVNWPRALAAVRAETGVSHLIDFGPGETAGIGAVSARLLEGAGVQVVLAGAAVGGRGMLERSVLFESDPAKLPRGADWREQYRPRLVRLASGELQIDNHFTRLYGRPPVIQAGMTPTSANAEFTAAVVRGGFHAELAGGGQHDEGYFRRRVEEIVGATPPGEGFHVNLLFLNQYLWGFQFPLVQMLAREGQPIEGVTVAAGVPSLERAGEIISALRSAGIRHVAFKPGARPAIQEVVRIAAANPESTIMLQWTGGRGGGHHSYEDAHEPILQSYAAIRSQPNIVLVFGSGVGDAVLSLPYLTGEWSARRGYPAMPFDGVLLGSRLMAAAEARTAPEAKALIAATPGIENEASWEGTYRRAEGGIRTVVSELGEPIHKIATRGIELWNEFDRNYFSVRDAAERGAKIRADRDAIARRINADYQKLYFGIEAGGRLRHLEEMSYAEVARRMLELMHVRGEAPRWIDVSFRDRLFDFLVRSEERFGVSKPILREPAELENDPAAVLDRMFAALPRAERQGLSREDLDYFLQLCRRPGKPVNFIPVIDADLAQWFKRDSLWQSEDLEAVPDRDVQRVAILQGPVAAAFTTRVDEPVAEIMDGIHQDLISALRAEMGEAGDIPEVRYLAPRSSAPVALPESIRVERRLEGEVETLHFTTGREPANLPEAGLWREHLAGRESSPLRALLTVPRIVRGRERIANPVAALFRPRTGQRIVVEARSGRSERIRIYDPLMARAASDGEMPILEASSLGDAIRIALHHPRPATALRPARVVTLELDYRLEPRQSHAPIHEAMPDLDARVRRFYGELWSDRVDMSNLDLNDFFTGSFVATPEAIERFVRAIGNRHERYLDQANRVAPLDFAIVAAWEPLVQTLFPEAVGGNLFNLVHRSNEFQILDRRPLAAGERVDSEFRIDRLQNLPAGRLVTVRGRLGRGDRPWLEVKSEFLIRGPRTDRSGFSLERGETRLRVATPEDLAVFQSRDWLMLNPASPLRVGDELRARYLGLERFGERAPLAETHINGELLRGDELVGLIDATAFDVPANRASDFLKRRGEAETVTFESGGYRMLAEPDAARAPDSNVPYSLASFDLNPIHDNPYLADFAGLPATITHGMWTSANARRVLETHLAFERPERIHRYRASFEGMVRPGETIFTQLSHVGMRAGRLVVEIESVNAAGERVLAGEAEVDQPETAFVFTGQGSQEAGMGMELYESSSVAREIWDRADAHFREQWGVSLLEIVRGDPKQMTEWTVHFGGRAGARIRENYRALSTERISSETGSRRVVPLFPGIEANTESHTFRAPKGLIHSTQFTQPALMLVEYAAYRDMAARGLLPPEARFAGHSLGEYAAISAVGEALPLNEVLDLVFLRGLTMQDAVRRDAQGRSPFGMSAVNPSRVAGLGEAGLRGLVAELQEQSGNLLEIVNFNVADQEYIVAGELGNLQALELGLRSLARGARSPEQVRELASGVLSEVAASRASAAEGRIVPQRGRTLPLEGIDVPFHSTALRDGVPAFRRILEARFPADVRATRLVGRYIPNLVARPFSLERDFVESVRAASSSPVLAETLRAWDASGRPPEGMARTLLIELLAYQFASPVRWIETQEHFFNQGVERVVEFGPQAILAGMAQKTLRSGRFPSRYPREILAHRSHRDLLNFATPDRGPSAVDYARSRLAPEAESSPVPDSNPAPALRAPSPAPARRSAPAAAVGDVPLGALDGLRALLSVKLRRPPSEIRPETTIRDLVGGKSALQNEILGDLSQEFGSGPDNAAELSLSELSSRIGGSYRAPGKITASLIARLAGGKMPAGFGLPQIRQHLSGERLLGEGRSHAVLLHALSLEPAARLASTAEATAWLDRAVDAYGESQGLRIPRASETSEGSAAGGGAMIDAAALQAARAEQTTLIADLLDSYRRYLGDDPAASARALEMERELREAAEAEGALWLSEHGEAYANGIRPIFDARRFREYDSVWNWGRQDLARVYHEMRRDPAARGRYGEERRRLLLNRATPELSAMARHYAERAGREASVDVANFFERLAADIDTASRRPASYRFPEAGRTRPVLKLGADGRHQVVEMPRFPEGALTSYAEEMGFGNGLSPFVTIRSSDPLQPGHREIDPELTADLLEAIETIQDGHFNLHGKTMLVTGAGPGSIGAEVARAGLQAGARVIVTTSNFSKARCDFYRALYRENGGTGSALTVLPFNQASVADVRALVEHIYSPEGLDTAVDFVLPFAGISEQGMDISRLGSLSELSHRVMLTNTLRLLGEIRTHHARRHGDTRPAQAILPLSPNHGGFGFDGLYAESKLGLESLMNKSRSEGWDRQLTVSGAVIGWTRGTNLMEGNDLVAPDIEELGARTFSQAEMALNLMALLYPTMRAHAERQPLWADFNGGFETIPDLAARVGEIRERIRSKERIERALLAERALELQAEGRVEIPPPARATRVNLDFAFPELPNAERLERLSRLRGMIDLSQVVVVTGFGEVGPNGNHRTRWELESRGEFSLEGTLEMARIMGLVRYHDGPLGERRHYCGWVDAASSEPVADADLIEIYGETIRNHSGIRVIEPELNHGYDPERKIFYREIAVTEDLPAFAVDSREDALSFRSAHGERAAIEERDGNWFVRLRRGAVLHVPRALNFDRNVAGQLPTGWDARRYGIGEDIIRQVDPTTLYALVATAEALVSAGITDPYEMYRYVHVSEVANTIGGGMGGMTSIRGGFRDRAMERPVQGGSSNLQEQLINVVPAWINMLLLSSSGPIRTPVAACATAAVSVELGLDAIRSGRAKIAVVGGFDDFGEEGAYEFAQMEATSSSAAERVRGREPREQSRPGSKSRAGFMESKGGAALILMRGDIALEMAVPIYGIVELSNTATDKQGASVPAPGQGILAATVREIADPENPLLDLEFRRARLSEERGRIRDWLEIQLGNLPGRASETPGVSRDAVWLAAQEAHLRRMAARMESSAFATWSHRFWQGEIGISPLRGALATWGLTPDDIEVASFHGTSTAANDRNESEVNQVQMEHLGRSPGNPVFTIWQKGLTGHPKGGAAGWMLNGLLQAMNHGLVPGGVNLDNVDPEFRRFEHLLYSDQSLDLGRPLRAGLMKSFGFGQAGAELLVISPEYFFGSLESDAFSEYARRREERQRLRYRHEHEFLTGRAPLVALKTEPPYDAATERSVYLNPEARVAWDSATRSWRFPGSKGPASSVVSISEPPHSSLVKRNTERLVSADLRRALPRFPDADFGTGVDSELIRDWTDRAADEGFLVRNFTAEEIAACRSRFDPVASFAARWAAKEAVIKAISNAAPDAPHAWRDAGAPLLDIEIISSTSGAPEVRLRGHAEAVARRLGIGEIKISFSHDMTRANAVAFARRRG